nr:TonB-dependent receptor [Novosphingobium flavum]
MVAHAQAAAEAAPSEDIVVTGSRTTKNGNDSPTPVTVVSKDMLTDVRPTSITESLNVLPVFSGSRGQTTNPSATGGVGGGNGNAAQLNLRNVGATRTLVLMDGRRVPPSSFTNIVDADVIPQMLIERVDTVTGGVSAVYGSDAVSGVVNFITNKNFNGVKATASAGISQYGDGRQVNLGIAAGTKIGDRGHFEMSYEFRDDTGVLRRSDRSWFTRPTVVASVVGSTAAAGSAANPWTLIENTTLANFPFGGRIIGCGTACGLAGQYFATDGTLSAFANGTATGTSGIQSGGAGGYADNSLKSAQRTHQAFARFDYELSDAVKFWAIGSYNYKRNSFFADDIQLSAVTMNRANAFLLPAYQSQMTASTFTFSRTLAQAERFNGIPVTTQYMFAGGLTGKVAEWDWNVAYTRGTSKLETLLRNNVNNQKLAASLDSVLVGSTPTCYAATQSATAAAYADCKPLNVFGPTSSSAAALDYILDDTNYVAWTRQHDVTADISGSPFDTWAGPVNVALSGEWRFQDFRSQSEATPTQYAVCPPTSTGGVLNCTPFNPATGAGTILYRQTFPASPKISQSVWEVAAEATVPLLRDVPLIQSFDVNGAVRYTKYNTVGEYWTWKLGADWKVTDDLRFRGTLSRDIRAPTLNDLFAPTSVVIVNNNDLKAGSPVPAPGQLPSVNQSNPNLTAEIGNTLTAGAVYKPSFAPGFSFAVDYYRIKIKNAITTVQGFQQPIQQGCYDQGIQLYCDLIVRNSSGAVTSWLVRPVNLSVVETYGFDFEANYAGQLGGRPLMLRALAAWQPHIRYIQPGTTTLDQGGVAFGPTGLIASPSWRVTGIMSYQVTDGFKFDVMYRWRNKLKISGNPTDNFVAGQGTMPAYGQASLNLSWKVPDGRLVEQSEFFINIQNLFNVNPPIGNQTNTGTGAGGFGGFAVGDDPIGRYFTAGVRVKF